MKAKYSSADAGLPVTQGACVHAGLLDLGREFVISYGTEIIFTALVTSTLNQLNQTRNTKHTKCDYYLS